MDSGMRATDNSRVEHGFRHSWWQPSPFVGMVAVLLRLFRISFFGLDLLIKFRKKVLCT